MGDGQTSEVLDVEAPWQNGQGKSWAGQPRTEGSLSLTSFMTWGKELNSLDFQIIKEVIMSASGGPYED